MMRQYELFEKRVNREDQRLSVGKMAGWKTDFEAATIVLLGTFNPAIFQPAWLGASKIIRQEEADNATITMVNPKLTAFSADWLNLQVMSERFQATTLNSAHYQALRDVVISVFAVLEQTPFWTMGMNRDMHFKIKSEEQWHQLGHVLAPKESWRPILDQPGLRSLTMQSAPSISDGIQITRTVRVEPSIQLMPGIYIQLNVEASLPDGANAGIIKQQDAARQLMRHLGDSWSNVLVEAQQIADHLLSQV